MKKTVVLLLSFWLLALAASAQFYYKDILSNKQLLADMASYKQNKIKTINIKSFEDDGSPSDGFFCQKKLRLRSFQLKMAYYQFYFPLRGY